MRRAVIAAFAVVLFMGLSAQKSQAQDKPILVVNLLTTAKDTPWPYNLPALQQRVIESMQKKFGDKATVVDKAPAGAGRVYTLDGQITKNYTQADTDLHDGGSTVYNEVVEIHYTLTDPSGKKLLEKKESFTTNTDPHGVADSSSPGPLAGQIAGTFTGRVDNTRFYGK